MTYLGLAYYNPSIAAMHPAASLVEVDGRAVEPIPLESVFG